MNEEKFSDEQLNQALAALVEPPADLTERILAVCHQEADCAVDTDEAAFLRPAESAPARRFRWRAWLSHVAVAAGVAVLCSVLAVRVLENRQSAAVPQRLAMSSAPAAVADAVAAPMETEEANEEAQPAAAPRLRVMAMKKLAQPTASVGADNAIAVNSYEAAAPQEAATMQGFSLADSRRLHASFAGDAGEAMAVSSVRSTALPSRRAASGERHEIADTVTQVWLTDTLPPTRENIESANKKLDGMHLELLDSDEENCTLIRVTAADSAIQRLVDDFHGRHDLTLLSPSLPQPGEENAVAFTGKQVTYLMKLLHR